jgi:hypothetical protein
MGYTKTRLELPCEKLEKAYQLVKDERRRTSELMIRHRSIVPTKPESAEELKGPGGFPQKPVVRKKRE